MTLRLKSSGQHLASVDLINPRDERLNTYPPTELWLLLEMGLRIAAYLLLVSSLAAVAVDRAAGFTCNATKTATCSAVAGYIPVNATTYAAIRAHFQVATLASLLGANGLTPTTPSNRSVPAGSTVRVPFPCACSNGTGKSDRTPIYTVKAGDDGLYAIATTEFGGLVKFQEIADASGVKDVNKILVGQNLTIPLPCSCDPVGGLAVVHLAHVVAAGTSVAGIAEGFGTDEATVLQLNGITDPKTLQAGQVLDIPLKACSSSITDSALDHNLLVPNNSYALTAGDCILCKCNSSKLECQPVEGLSSSACPAAKCGSLEIGGNSKAGCDVTTCNYGGYTTNGTQFNILTNTTNTTESTCSTGGVSPALGANWVPLFLGLQTALILFLLSVTS